MLPTSTHHMEFSTPQNIATNISTISPNLTSTQYSHHDKDQKSASSMTPPQRHIATTLQGGAQ